MKSPTILPIPIVIRRTILEKQEMTVMIEMGMRMRLSPNKKPIAKASRLTNKAIRKIVI